MSAMKDYTIIYIDENDNAGQEFYSSGSADSAMLEFAFRYHGNPRKVLMVGCIVGSTHLLTPDVSGEVYTLRDIIERAKPDATVHLNPSDIAALETIMGEKIRNTTSNQLHGLPSVDTVLSYFCLAALVAVAVGALVMWGKS